jgi:hypothetical protein
MDIAEFLSRYRSPSMRESLLEAVKSNAESTKRAREAKVHADEMRQYTRISSALDKTSESWSKHLAVIGRHLESVIADRQADAKTPDDIGPTGKVNYTRFLRRSMSESRKTKQPATMAGTTTPATPSLASRLLKYAAVGAGAVGASVLASSAKASETDQKPAEPKEAKPANLAQPQPPITTPEPPSVNNQPEPIPASGAKLTQLDKDITALEKEVKQDDKPAAQQPPSSINDIGVRPSSNINDPVNRLFQETQKLIEKRELSVKKAIEAAEEETTRSINEGSTLGVNKGDTSTTPSATPGKSGGAESGGTGAGAGTPATGGTIGGDSPRIGASPSAGGSFTGGGTGAAGSPANGSTGAGVASSGGRPPSQSLARNQQEAFNAAKSEGMTSKASKLLVANMSGEALHKPNAFNRDYNSRGQFVHMAQGIVQWDENRSERIYKQFGKYPKDMTVTEQTKAAVWEMKTHYKKAWNMLNDESAPDQSRMYGVVKHFEAPAHPDADTIKRLDHLQRMRVREDGSFEDVDKMSKKGGEGRQSIQPINVQPAAAYSKTVNSDGSITVKAGEGAYKSSVFNNPEEAKNYLRSISAIGGSSSIMRRYGYDSIGDMNDELALKSATAFHKYNSDAKSAGLTPATLNSAVRFPLPGMPGGFANKENSAHAGTMAFDAGFRGVMQNHGKNIYTFEEYAKKEGIQLGRKIYGDHEGHHFSLVPNKHNPFKGNYDSTGRPVDLEKMKRATSSGFVATYPGKAGKDAASTPSASAAPAKQSDAGVNNSSRYTAPSVPQMTQKPDTAAQTAAPPEQSGTPKAASQDTTVTNSESQNIPKQADFEDHSESDINYKKAS